MKKIGSVLIIVLIIFFGVIGFNYVNYRSLNAVSDAAFVKSDDLLFLSFKVSGKVISLTKNEGDIVKKGELLAKLDPIDFLVQKKKISHEIESLEAKKQSLVIKKAKLVETLKIKRKILDNKKAKLMPNIDALQFGIDALNEKFIKINKDLKRFQILYKQNLIEKEKVENLSTKQKELLNNISSKKSQLMALKLDFKDIKYNIDLIDIEKKSIDELSQNIIEVSKKIDSLKNTKEALENKIKYSSIYSPIDGIVAKRFISNNRVVGKGGLIFSIVDPANTHLEVLLSEKKLSGVNVGNSVKINIDAIKDKEFKGVVDSILPASASTFSLVPRDIASGEFTKLDQRFIVRIKIVDKISNLRVGMGATVAIKRD